jgi:hypothetical protein
LPSFTVAKDNVFSSSKRKHAPQMISKATESLTGDEGSVPTFRPLRSARRFDAPRTDGFADRAQRPEESRGAVPGARPSAAGGAGGERSARGVSTGRGRAVALYAGVLIAGFALGGAGQLLLGGFPTDLGEGAAARRLWQAVSPVPPRDLARAPDEPISSPSRNRTPSAADAAQSGLVERMERQIAAGRLDQPAGDNAIETYRRAAALSGDPVVTEGLGVKVSTAVWRAADAAKQAQHWDEALRYFGQLQTLPPVPPEIVLGSRQAKPVASDAALPTRSPAGDSPRSSPSLPAPRPNSPR